MGLDDDDDDNDDDDDDDDDGDDDDDDEGEEVVEEEEEEEEGVDDCGVVDIISSSIPSGAHKTANASNNSVFKSRMILLSGRTAV